MTDAHRDGTVPSIALAVEATDTPIANPNSPPPAQRFVWTPKLVILSPLPFHTSWYCRDRWWLAHLSDRKSAAALLVGYPWWRYPSDIRFHTDISAH